MRDDDMAKLLEDLQEELRNGRVEFGMLGDGPAAFALAAWFRTYVPHAALTQYGTRAFAGCASRPLTELDNDRPQVVVVAEDPDKESVIREAAPYLSHAPKLLVAGYAHLAFRDPLYLDTLDELLVPSIANGYPNSLIHIFQCLQNAARLNLEGCVAEFGVFKGGTTMFMARVIKSLGMEWPVFGFDTFSGFPPRRSALDMYDHPGAEYSGYQSVQHYLSSEKVELVVGDIVQTAARLRTEKLVLSFIDTDNYSSARAAVEAIIDSTVVGGAIVFDHYTGVDRFRYTLGERMAAAETLVGDNRYFNLHSTGVFLRQQ